MFMRRVIWSRFEDYVQLSYCQLTILYILQPSKEGWDQRSKRANTASRTSKRRRISDKTVSPRNDEDHVYSSTDPSMVQFITAAVTQSVFGELQKAGILAGHPDQQQDNELSQTVATASPDEAQQKTSSNTTTINNIDSLQLPAMLFATATKKPDSTNKFFTLAINL